MHGRLSSPAECVEVARKFHEELLASDEVSVACRRPHRVYIGDTGASDHCTDSEEIIASEILKQQQVTLYKINTAGGGKRIDHTCLMRCSPLKRDLDFIALPNSPSSFSIGTFNEDGWGYYWQPKSKHPVLLDASLNVCMFTTKARVPYIEDGQDPWIKELASCSSSS